MPSPGQEPVPAPSAPGGRAAMPRVVFGIRFCLTAVMAALLLFTVAAVAYAILTFTRLRDTTSRLAAEELPALVSAQRIADAVTSLAETLHRPHEARGAEDARYHGEEAGRRLAQVRAELRELAPGGGIGAGPEAEAMRREITAAFESLARREQIVAEILSRRTRLGERREALRRELREAYAAYTLALDEANRQMRALVARTLAIELPAARDELELQQRLDAFQDREMSWLGTTQDLRTDGRELIGLAEAILTAGPAALGRLADQAALVTLRMARHRRLPGTAVAEALAQRTAAFTRFFEAEAPEGPLHLRRQELALERQAAVAFAGMEADQAALRQAAARLVVALSQGTGRVIRDTRERVALASRYLLWFSLLAAVAGALVIHRVVLGRIRRMEWLTASMLRAAAEAEQGSPSRIDAEMRAVVQGRGRDEIAAMGRALLTFVEAIAQRDRAREKADQAVRQYAATLEQRVQERTHELAVANRQLQAASRHKSEFLASMSHELRTPLNSVIGFSDLLLGQSVGPLNARQHHFLSNVHKSAQHLLRLINDILDLSKVEAGKFVLQREPVSVPAVLEDVLVIARGLANKKGQSLDAEIAADLAPPLSADPVRLKQILFNLLSNAVKFTPEGGTITVTARTVGQSGQAPRHSGEDESSPSAGVPECRSAAAVEIAVQDTGAGIRPEDLPKLFREFVQLDTTQAQHHEGSGLGLALTRRLVELHGGRIWAESAGEGRGSRFTVALPAGPQDGTPAPGAAGRGAAPGGEDEL